MFYTIFKLKKIGIKMAFQIDEEYVLKVDYEKLSKKFTKKEMIIPTGNIYPRSYTDDKKTKHIHENVEPWSDEEFYSIDL